MTSPVQAYSVPNQYIFIVFSSTMGLLHILPLITWLYLHSLFSSDGNLLLSGRREYLDSINSVLFLLSIISLSCLFLGMLLFLGWYSIKIRKVNVQVDEEKISLLFSKETKILYWHEIEKYSCNDKNQTIDLKPKKGSLFHLNAAQEKEQTNFQTLIDQIKKYSELYPSITTYDFFRTGIGRFVLFGIFIPLFLILCGAFIGLFVIMLKDEQFHNFVDILSLLEMFAGVLFFGYSLWNLLNPTKK